MGKMSKDKGKRGERELAAYLRKHGVLDARRGQQYNGSDGSADVIGLPGYHIECKRTERFHIYDAIEQSVQDAREGERPIVVHRKNRGDWLVIMRFDDFLETVTHSSL